MATSVPDVISSNQPGGEGKVTSTSLKGKITLVFDIHVNKKYGFQKLHVRNLTLARANPRLRDLTEHLETHLLLPSGQGRKLLLLAVCTLPVSSSKKANLKIVPLVCEQIWFKVLQHHPGSRLKILVNQQQSVVVTRTKSCRERLFGAEVKVLDIASYLPTRRLGPDNIVDLCHTIFEKRVKIKHSLRKGVWMHLVGVFPPELRAREQREAYVEQLRMVYDSLKGKWKGEQEERSSQVNQLVEAVHRDAVRTDPNHPFYVKGNTATETLSPDSISNILEESNVQKLVNIITIYILEHGDVSYTQGMTDLLSPFLYVMKREADAYICFAAMVERIKSHFDRWCEGTLLKIERLRHICEVLDPELFYFLTNKIEEDAFALFFGMVLIECRREFSFDDSFELFEAIWAGVTCMKNSLSHRPTLSISEWARFMTYESKEVIQQVFGETQSPYSARPLPRSYSDSIVPSRNPSMLSQGSVESQAHQYPSVEPTLPTVVGSGDPSPDLSINRTDSISGDLPVHSGGIYQHTVTVDVENDETDPSLPSRPRSYTDPNLNWGNDQDEMYRRCESTPPKKSLSGAPLTISPTHLSSLSHSESELRDNFSNGKLPANAISSKTPTEMADLSSVSSANSTNGNSHSSSNLHRDRAKVTGGRAANESTKDSSSSNSSVTSPDPEFRDQKMDTTPMNGLKTTISSQSTSPSSAYLTAQEESSVAKITASPQSTSPSSAYLTAQEDSSAGHSSRSQSPRSRLRRVVRRGERITTESIPDESHIDNNHQASSCKSTPNKRPYPGATSPLRTRSPQACEEVDEETEQQKSRVTPVAFFDVMENIASSAPGTSTNSGNFDENDELEEELTNGRVRHTRANSDVSLIMSQLTHADQANPRVTRERSLSIPVSDCFPLFVCVAILAQHRTQIMQRITDFVGLSVILNAQAGQQDIEKTLYIARDLYRIYKSYQVLYIGEDTESLNTWLDDDRANDTVVENGHVPSGVSHHRQNSRDSTDSVF